MDNFHPVIPAKAGIQRIAAKLRLCQNQDLQDWRDFQDFGFAHLALFAIIGNPAKTNADERLSVEDAPEKS